MKWRTHNYKLSDYRTWIKDKKLLVPKIQRSLVWNSSQKASLLETIQDGLPFGAITLHERDNKQYIIDGLQRTTTLLNYYNDKLSNLNFGELKSILKDKKYIKSFSDQAIKFSDEEIRKISDAIKQFDDILDIKEEDLSDLVTSINNEVPFAGYRDLETLITKVRARYSELTKIDIPTIVFTGNEDEAGKLFERINQQGTPLTEIEKLSTHWASKKIKIKDEDFNKVLEGKYESIVKTSLKIEETESKNPTEVIYYIMHKVFSKYEDIIGKHFFSHGKKNEDVINMQEFLLFLRSTLKPGTILESKEVGNVLTEKCQSFTNIQTYIHEIKETVNLLKTKAPILIMNKFKTSNKLQTLKLGHTAISTYMSFLYNERFGKKINSDDINNIDPHVLIDIIEGTFGSNSSESGLRNISDKTYEVNIDAEYLWSKYVTMFETYKYSPPSKVNFDLKAKALMYFVYQRIMNEVQTSSLNYHLDHIIPKSNLKELKIPGVRSFANLSFLEVRKNQNKSDTYNPKFLSQDPITKGNDKVEESYILFMNKRSPQNYIKFCETRLDAIKEKFMNSYNLNE